MKKRKRRSVAASRAASRKAWRTRKRMKSFEPFLTEEFVHASQNYKSPYGGKSWTDALREPRTIDLLPKIKWG